jgi:hypothetical protein
VWSSSGICSWSALDYIDDVLRAIRYCRFHICANDLQIYQTCSASDFQRCIDEMDLDLQRVHKWVAANGLQLKSVNSQVIVIGRCVLRFNNQDKLQQVKK